MELFALYLGSYDRWTRVTEYESLVWNSRWQDLGDFEIIAPSTPHTRKVFQTSRPLELLGSEDVMIIEKVIHEFNEKGDMVIRASGRSFGVFLLGRPVPRKNPGWGDNKKSFNTQGWPTWVAAELVTMGLVDTHAARDKIHNVVVSSSRTDGLSGPRQTLPYSDMHTAIRNLMLGVDYGFKFTIEPMNLRGETNSYRRITFRTVKGSEKPDVVYSTINNTLKNSRTVLDISERYHAAEILKEDGTRFTTDIYADMNVNTINRAERMTLFLDGSSIRKDDYSSSSDYTMALRDFGQKALLESLGYSIDGQVEPNLYEYTKDYYVGDIVIVESHVGIVAKARVMENIWSFEGSTGWKIYPTLKIMEIISD